MNVEINHKIIKEMCGTVSFKRGDSFYRANKVILEYYSPARCEATVSGMEDFHVTIEKDENGSLLTACSCPTLASVKTDCQHIAATLLAIYEHQRQGTAPIVPREYPSDSTTNKALTEGLLSLFNNQPIRSSSHQLHFENRKVLDVEFTCKPVSIGKGQFMFGIEMKIDSTHVQHIRDFLEQIKGGDPSLISQSLTYDSSLHCFHMESDAVIQQLIQVVHDEKVFVDSLQDHFDRSNRMLIIPPSSWERLLPLLVKAPLVKLEYGGETYEGLILSEELPPLHFDFTKTERGNYQLKINGLHRLLVLNSYLSILSRGKLIRLEKEDCGRLSELKQMIEISGTNQIPILEEQLEFFMEKVVPGLRRLGEVQISPSITNQLMQIPLIAKLYLDRVKNRLLAGLEFHYGNIVINPLEDRNIQKEAVLIRDEAKENVILQLMEDSSFAKTEGGYFLHNEELEYEFLYHVAPKLQKLVQIYATTAVRNRIFRENTRPQIRVKVKKERTNWLEFKFEMDGIPEKQIREVLIALEEKRKYYRLRNGSLLSLEAREFEEIQRFLHAIPVQNEDLESGLNMPIVQGLRLLDSADEGSVFTLEESFRQFLKNILNPDSLEIEVPKSVEPILRDYQKQGYKWMKTLASFRFGGILADDMGLGKTLQSITFILSELSIIREKKQPVLVACPASLIYNWLSEFMKFAPEVQAVVIDGNKSERVNLQKNASDIDVVITSYPLLRRDIKWYEKQIFHTVFFDEAQAFKNPITQTARAVKRIQADHRFALTGTPVENSLEELWSIFHVVFPELFMGLKEYSHLTRETISRRIRPFLLRRLKEDVLAELPEKIETVDSVELLPEQKKLYAAYLAKLRHETLKHLDKETIRKNRIRILAGLTRLRQICCHPALFVDGYKGSSAKFEQLLKIIEESMHSGRRVLIFSQFTKMLQIIGRELAHQGLPFFYLDGQTPSEERVKITNRFNAGERNLFLISLKAGGTGLNLTGADTVILYDLWWNPAVEEQAADRAHRIGQTKIVQVIKLVARGTIEEKMNELQEKKRDLIEEIFDSNDSGPALTEEDIREIFEMPLSE
ncbi:DEAD/DEAH box helicase [Bacillus sp. FJAT-49705]|uniref:DEAD/DEAH box helicase n=1 Tax=Cytobacillus citreus TaxID=2833586 RepID=A0ABS5NQ46_9BACI|nr:DEAD/DEAH box helicase [Cytobacillus citreus]MBS4189952.1 DEAD/DEAH box helicase [Cytobacillus citreus]